MINDIIDESTNLERMEILITAGMDRAAGLTAAELTFRITSMQGSGMNEDEILDRLYDDFDSQGMVFGTMRSNIKNTVRSSLHGVSNESSMLKYLDAGERQYKWVVVSSKPCPDCSIRHGLIGDIEFFEALGLPRSGFSVCGQHCKCKLVPEAYKGSDLNGPVIV